MNSFQTQQISENDISQTGLYSDEAEELAARRQEEEEIRQQQHQQLLEEQEEHLDRLGHSVSRQHELSIQIGNELDGQEEILDDLDMWTDRSQSRLDKAKRSLDTFSRKAKENGIYTYIIIIIKKKKNANLQALY